MKFLHTSNINIGMFPDPDKFWSSDREKDIKDTFIKIIKMCDEMSIDLLLISGNLFYHQPTFEELNFVNDNFKKIPNTNVIIVAGSNDYIKSNSPILNFNFSENVYYFLNNIPETFHIENKNIAVHGFSYYSPEESSPLTNSININDNDIINILMFYGGDTRHVPFDLNKLVEKNISYIALGLDNNYQELIEKKAYYPGSPEPLSQVDEGDHGVVIGEIDEKTNAVKSINFVKTAKISYIPILVKVNSKTTEADVATLVSKEAIRQGSDNIYKIIIEGMRNPDIEFSEYILSSKIKIISFDDRSKPKYDFVKLSSEHPKDMIGAFIRKMTTMNKELSDIEKKALYLGTQALIKSTEKEHL